MTPVPLCDSNAFELVSGLWKGERGPLAQARVLRSTNFRGDGLLDFADAMQLDVEERHIANRSLQDGDIIIERSGGGPKQPVGRVALFQPPDDQLYFSSNFTTTLRIRDRNVFDPEYVALYLHGLYLTGATEALQRATTGIRNLDWQEYLRFEVPARPLAAQVRIANLIGGMRTAYRIEDAKLDSLQALKGAAMAQLFQRGLRGEPQKETELGSIPENWDVEPLRANHSVASGGTPSRSNPTYWVGGSIPWVKTAEVDYCVIERTEELITPAGLTESAAKLLPAGTLLLAMYGQGVTRGKVAILGIDAACNQACAAIRAIDDRIEVRYLYHYLVSRYSAIRQLAHGGQQQNLNLDIVRDLQVAFPTDKAEQNEIVTILEALDRKIDLHQRKRAVLDDLFKALLHKLMTGEIAVDELDLSALDRAAVPEGAPA